MSIRFNSENVALPDLNFEIIENWIGRVAASHGYTVGRLSYLFCDDNYILEANRKFLGHDYFTDIITFDYTRQNIIGGDMIISLDTVKSNSLLSEESYERELKRVIIHGVLHLCGINDKASGEREVMERHENEALSLLDIDNLS